jgi:hypothetical protein
MDASHKSKGIIMNTVYKNTQIDALFPAFSDFVMRKVQMAETAKSKLIRREKYMVSGSALILTLIILGFIVEFAIGFLFNDKLVSASLNEELSVVDQIIRAAAALGSIAALMGVGFAFHVVFKSKVAVPIRIIAFMGAIVCGVGIYYMAGSIGYQSFATSFDRMWGGTSITSTPPATIDDVAAVAPAVIDAAQSSTPFWLRLMASSALFVGVAFFVVILELVWLHIRERLAHVREVIAEADMILGKYNRAQSAKSEAIAKDQEINMQSDPEYQQNHVLGALISGIQGWQKQIEARRSDTTNIGTLSPEEYKRRNEIDAKIDKAIEETKVFSTDSEKIRQIVAGVFSKPVPPIPATPNPVTA